MNELNGRQSAEDGLFIIAAQRGLLKQLQHRVSLPYSFKPAAEANSNAPSAACSCSDTSRPHTRAASPWCAAVAIWIRTVGRR